MIDSLSKKYDISSDGVSKLYYEDLSSLIELTVADFRDSVLWLSVDNIKCKDNKKVEKLSNEQKFELYRRISADLRLHGYEEVYTDEFEFVKEDMANIDCSKNILEI